MPAAALCSASALVLLRCKGASSQVGKECFCPALWWLATSPAQHGHVFGVLCYRHVHRLVCLVVAGGLQIPVWGGGAENDIAIAYEKAAAAVLAHRPTYLIAAQGLMAGRDLRAAVTRPLVLRTKWPDGPIVRNQLVYEAHEYPFLW
jgi:hypothetical protein